MTEGVQNIPLAVTSKEIFQVQIRIHLDNFMPLTDFDTLQTKTSLLHLAVVKS